MTSSVSLLPPYTGSFLPPAVPVGLTDYEQSLVTGLSVKLGMQSVYVRTRYLYYHGEQAIQNLGISVPSVLAGVRQVVDWPRIAVDRLGERASVIDGFRLAGATEIDSELAELCRATDLDAELPLAVQDSLVAGRGYIIVGAPDDDAGSPIATAESPLNMAVMWDPRTRSVTAAYQSYEVEGIYRAVLYLPNQTVYMSRDQQSPWGIDYRDVHNFGEVPVVRLPNRAESSDREGRSEISAAIMSTTDSACRSLLGMEIAREVYSVPHLYILGAKESDFQAPDGSPKSAMDMAMTKVLALERDAKGDVPTIGQIQAFDPSVFTKIIDEGAQLMSSYTGFPPAYFGQATSANPASADAIRVAENGIERGARRVQRQGNAPLRKVGQLMWRFAHRGEALPAEYRNLEVDWVDVATPTPAATSDAMFKQASMGAVPAYSDVVLKRLGYSAVERAQLAQDRDLAASLEAELTASIAGKQARSANALANDMAQATATVDAVTADAAADTTQSGR